ncbi:hypothetical protein TKK_0012202 [Trichogramma kaykai]|uniref:SREBP regulating gene protein n=1 Tax=Trichogramma kaykai TaxID=54128 RepID=A0ABD2WNE6_9HYME
MFSWMTVSRYFRRRLVIGFTLVILLFIYLVLNSSISEKLGIFGNDFDDMENINLNENDVLLSDEDTDDNYGKSSGKSLLWRLEVMNDIGNAMSDEVMNSGHFISNGSLDTCRNSVQGKFLIADDQGNVCLRRQVLQNGCCDVKGLNKMSNVSDVPSIVNKKYSCKSCNPKGCCAIFEYCVSCCLNSNRIKNKKASPSVSVARESIKYKQGKDILKLRLQSLDGFQLCLSACRTSSASVRQENQYRDPVFKYCYVLQLSDNRLKFKQKRSANAVLNKIGDAGIALTTSSALCSFDPNQIIQIYSITL